MALQHIRSSTLDKRPQPASLSDGQLAINTNMNAPGVFFKDSNGALVKVGPTFVGTTAPNSTPGSGGSTGNTLGEQWLDTSGGTYVLKIWDGTAWRSEAGEFVNVTGDTMTGALVMDNQQQVRFRETTANGTNFIALQAPASVASDKTITLPDVTGTVVTTGDTGSVTSTMIADGTIVNGDVNASAAIAGTKIDPDFGSQTIETTGVFSAAGGAAATPSITFTGDLNTGIYSPGADQLAISSSGSERIRIGANGEIGIGGANYGTSGQVLTSGGSGAAPSWTTLTVNTDKIEEGNSSAEVIDTGSDGRFVVTTEGTERLRVDSSGRVGIGSTSPATRLRVEDSSATSGLIASFQNTSTGVLLGLDQPGVANWRFGLPAGSDAFAIYGFGSGSYPERLRIDSSGRLLVGTSTARETSTVTWKAQIEGANELTGLGITTNQNGGAAAYLSLAKSRGATIGSNTIVQADDALGAILFSGADGTDANTQAATIICAVDGTPGANDMPGRLVFSTTADGASSPTERMRITNDGRVGVNTTNYTNGRFIVTSDSSSVTNTVFRETAAGSSSVNTIAFFRDATIVGTVSTTNAATAYNTSSDYRLKENVTAVTDGIIRLQQLKPSRFNFIVDPGKTVDGFLAHEVQNIVPEAITGAKDEVDEDGNPVYQGIDQSKLVPLLTAALQEALAEIESLKARVTALEP